MSPVLSEAARAALAQGRTAALWVFFTDKGIRGERAFASAVRAAGDRLSERSRARRAREQGGTFTPDYDDVPVPDRYVEAVRAAGGRVRHVSKWLNAASVMADESAAGGIAALPFVRAILPLRVSRRVRALGESKPLPPTPPEDGLQAPMFRDEALGAGALAKPVNYGPSITQLSGINVIAAHDSGWSAAGVILAMFDTGYNKSHSAVSPVKRIAEWDFIFHDGETANQSGDASSQWEHGTGTWSVAGGYWQGNLIGPAYNATFILAKTEYVPSETPVEEDNWVAAAEWADSIGADVISSSLAYLEFDDPHPDYSYSDLDGYTTVVTLGAVFAHRRGILVASAASNTGPGVGSIWAPADADSIVTVGAVDSGNMIQNFSSRGPTFDGRIKPEVVAQGAGTYWAVAGDVNAIAPAGGTSLATPLVAGAAALVREAHPEWTVAQVRQALMLTADKAGTPDNNYGWGRINTVRAIYGSALGGPIYPKPFDLLSPANNTTVATTPVTLRWRRSKDPNPGDAISYQVELRSVTPSQVIYSATTTDSFTVVASYFGPNKAYEWTVSAVDLLGHDRPARERFRFTTGATTDVAVPPSASRVILHQNRPNPAQRVTDIPFTLGGQGDPVHTTLRIYDPRGRLVRTLVEGLQATGRHYMVRWDGRDQFGNRAGSGIYYYQLRAAGAEQTRRLVLLR
jgi:hypothetical protein